MVVWTRTRGTPSGWQPGEELRGCEVRDQGAASGSRSGSTGTAAAGSRRAGGVTGGGGVGGRLLHRDPQHLERAGPATPRPGPRRPGQVAPVGALPRCELAAVATAAPRRRGRRRRPVARPEATWRTISLSRSTRAGSLASTAVQSPVAGRGQPHVGRRGPHHRHAGLGERVGQVVELLAQPGVVHRVAQVDPLAVDLALAQVAHARHDDDHVGVGRVEQVGQAGPEADARPCPRPRSRPRGAPARARPAGSRRSRGWRRGLPARRGRRSRPRTRGPASRPASRRPAPRCRPRRRPGRRRRARRRRCRRRSSRLDAPSAAAAGRTNAAAADDHDDQDERHGQAGRRQPQPGAERSLEPVGDGRRGGQGGRHPHHEQQGPVEVEAVLVEQQEDRPVQQVGGVADLPERCAAAGCRARWPPAGQRSRRASPRRSAPR